MTDYVFYPVTGDGQTQATGYVWHGGATNWNTGADWAAESSLLLPNPNPLAGAAPAAEVARAPISRKGRVRITWPSLQVT